MMCTGVNVRCRICEATGFVPAQQLENEVRKLLRNITANISKQGGLMTDDNSDPLGIKSLELV